VLDRAKVKFCGYLISDDGIRPPPNLEAIKNYPKPTTVKGLKSFLGAVNFYKAALPNLGTIAAPLHKLLQGKKPRFAPLVFSKEADVAFDNLKLAVSNHATLAHPRSDADTVLVSDASNFGCGASIMQRINNAWRPIAFFSKHFSPAQCKSSTFSREPLGLYLAVNHFRHYFEGNLDMIMYCDHEHLVKAFYSSNQRDNARECRHLSEIASLCANLRFIKECDNVMADALSRIEINSIFQHAAKIDWHAFAKAQRNDYELKRYLGETNPANVIEQEAYLFFIVKGHRDGGKQISHRLLTGKLVSLVNVRQILQAKCWHLKISKEKHSNCG